MARSSRPVRVKPTAEVLAGSPLPSTNESALMTLDRLVGLNSGSGTKRVCCSDGTWKDTMVLPVSSNRCKSVTNVVRCGTCHQPWAVSSDHSNTKTPRSGTCPTSAGQRCNLLEHASPHATSQMRSQRRTMQTGRPCHRRAEEPPPCRRQLQHGGRLSQHQSSHTRPEKPGEQHGTRLGVGVGGGGVHRDHKHADSVGDSHGGAGTVPRTQGKQARMTTHVNQPYNCNATRHVSGRLYLGLGGPARAAAGACTVCGVPVSTDPEAAARPAKLAAIQAMHIAFHQQGRMAGFGPT